MAGEDPEMEKRMKDFYAGKYKNAYDPRHEGGEIHEKQIDFGQKTACESLSTPYLGFDVSYDHESKCVVFP